MSLDIFDVSVEEFLSQQGWKSLPADLVKDIAPTFSRFHAQKRLLDLVEEFKKTSAIKVDKKKSYCFTLNAKAYVRLLKALDEAVQSAAEKTSRLPQARQDMIKSMEKKWPFSRVTINRSDLVNLFTEKEKTSLPKKFHEFILSPSASSIMGFVNSSSLKIPKGKKCFEGTKEDFERLVRELENIGLNPRKAFTDMLDEMKPGEALSLNAQQFSDLFPYLSFDKSVPEDFKKYLLKLSKDLAAWSPSSDIMAFVNHSSLGIKNVNGENCLSGTKEEFERLVRELENMDLKPDPEFMAQLAKVEQGRICHLYSNHFKLLFPLITFDRNVPKDFRRRRQEWSDKMGADHRPL